MRDEFPPHIAAARAQWTFRGDHRPPFAEAPTAGQLSVWDFPRPPRLERHVGTLEVRFGEHVIAKTTAGHLVCETAHPPTYYFPSTDVDPGWVRPRDGSTLCEWKGHASYFDVGSADEAQRPPLTRAAWCYDEPFEPFGPIAGAIAFMPTVLSCFVNGERVRPQPGGFYGGWITSRYVGPFKGEPGITG